MAETYQYAIREDSKITRATDVAEVFDHWRGDEERWLFVSPHDDDTVFGAGMTVAMAADLGVDTHAVVTTDGSMGYCDEETRFTIADVRRRETIASFRHLGVSAENIHFLNFPDCDLSNFTGRRRIAQTDKTHILGYTGLQNAFTSILRTVRPTRILMPTRADLHPDHKITNQEVLISLFHAQGEIWPELGPPIAEIPSVYEFAVYCDFPEPPQIQIIFPESIREKKMAGVAAYESQRQVAIMVETLKKSAPIEYLRHVDFHLYDSKVYHGLFAE